MTIRTQDGAPLLATDPAEIVRELNEISFTPEPTPEKFMTESAARILTFSGRKIRTDTPENYVSDLFAFGFLCHDDDPPVAADKAA